MSKVQHRTVVDTDAGMRLDRWFKAHFPDLGFGQLQRMLRTGQVRIDGARVKASARVEAGQSIRIPPGVDGLPAGQPNGETSRPGAGKRQSLPPTPADIEFVQSLVIHRDADLLVLNKPAGLAVQGGSHTLRHLDGLLDGLCFDAPERPRLVHRLDKDTSGVLLLARHREAARQLSLALRHREAKKLYWALVIGVPRPEEGIIDLPLVKAGFKGQERVRPAESATDGVQKAVTHFQTIDRAPPRMSWLAMMPITGRTHQLRVHAAAIGHPIVGDGKYGGGTAHPGGQISRKLHLHARTLRIPHPAGGWLEQSAEPPEHMAASWKLLGLDINAPNAELAAWENE